MPDLLPDDFGTETVTPPVVILREQAEHLSRRTGGVVLARVITQSANSSFLHRFLLEVPSLDDYVYDLFVVSHSFPLYPLRFQTGATNALANTTAANQTEFEELLRTFFALPEVRQIVPALKAQAVPAGAPA